MSLFPTAPLDAIRAASGEAMVDACAFGVPGTGGAVDDITGNDTGPDTPPVSYDGACSYHGHMPEVTLARAAAEGSPVVEANAWLRLPAVGDTTAPTPITPEAYVAWRNAITDISGTATHRGVTERFESKGIEKRDTHTRLYVRIKGGAVVAEA